MNRRTWVRIFYGLLLTFTRLNFMKKVSFIPNQFCLFCCWFEKLFEGVVRHLHKSNPTDDTCFYTVHKPGSSSNIQHTHVFTRCRNILQEYQRLNWSRNHSICITLKDFGASVRLKKFFGTCINKIFVGSTILSVLSVHYLKRDFLKK